ncbi:DUF6069 family protein [Actinomadura gamaensis]|uniref:DUF6069 family protein n=1 Tax=Actinomadura gamaensis TaxID=1763541 RepID=A0ABV9U2C0_9ACTN
MSEPARYPARGGNGPAYDRGPGHDGGPAYDRGSPPPVPPAAPPASVSLDAGRLWRGGLATMAVAALVAFVGVLIARGVFGVELLAPKRAGTIGDSEVGGYVFLAGAGALVATLILQVLALLTPEPLSFFSWIVGLITLIFAVAPFTTDAALSSQFATGLINLCVGLTILSLLPRSGYASRAPSG